MQRKKSEIRSLTLSAMLTAAGTVILLCGALVEIMELSVAAIASLAVAVAIIELNRGYGLLVFLATGLLAFWLLPNKTAALDYAVLFGMYPIVKSLAERAKFRALEWVVKGLYCAGAFALLYWIARLFLETAIPSGWYLVGILALGAVAFVVYDFALSGMIAQYIRRIHGRFRH